MKIGVDYYPEHWDRALWEKDADLMKEAGVQIVRMAEFAWSRLEPQEGVYDFAWLDDAIALFAEREIEVFLCTPTCTPPLWLFEKYPETIQVDKSGHRIPIGIRGHRCLNSKKFREKSALIISEMVSRYRDNSWVVGYQIDNELEANHCCCETCTNRFREYIMKKYGTVEAVNKAYGNNVWSGEYSAFSQVTPPFGPFQTWLNPSYMLDFNRYASASTVDYVEFQRQLIHSIDEKALITTNNWLCENMPDFYDMFEKLDFVSYDNYPTTVLPQDEETLYSHAFHLDLMRGIKKKNFWIMEQLSGGLGSWMPMSANLQPGMLKGYALQAIAHGADAVVHFRWRTAVSGAEMYWHGIIDHSNVPGRRFEEFKDLCQEVKGLQALDGSVINNKVAILYSSEQEYGFKIQPQVEGMHYFTQLKAYHDAFTCLGVGVDIVDEKSDLSEYGLVVAPTMYVTDTVLVENLKNYVKAGGHLVLTNRSGVKDEYNKCIMAQLPTVFAEMTGAVVKEYNPIGETKQGLKIVSEDWKRVIKTAGQMQEKIDSSFHREEGESILDACKKECNDIDDEPYRVESSLWCDIVQNSNAEVLAEYTDNYYANEAAITRNTYESGVTYYVGTVPNRKGMISFARLLLQDAGILYVEGLPCGVEMTVREKGDDAWLCIFNNTTEKQIFSTSVVNNNLSRLTNQKYNMNPFEMKIVQV